MATSMIHKMTPWLVLALLLLLLPDAALGQQCVKRDQDALLEFKAGLFDNRNQLGSWQASGNCCQFAGITCNAAGEVVDFTFDPIFREGCEVNCPVIAAKSQQPNSENLVGKTLLSKLEALEVLNLTIFRLRDVVPSAVDGSKLPRLRVLILTGFGFRGPLSPDLGSFRSLQVLDLGGNRLISGPVPASFCNLVNLRLLDFTNSGFGNEGALSGAIPSCIGTSFSQLQFLRLEYNRFTGGVPESLSGLTELRELLLTGNKLTGSIPAALGKLPKLVKLSLQLNDFTGPVPAALGNVVTLQELKIGGTEDYGGVLNLTRISGTIPASFANLKNLRTLYIRASDISGPIPAGFGLLQFLTDLQLDHNHLSGPLPSLGSTNLTTLRVDNNQLSGSLPEDWAGLTNLDNLEASSNQLTGSIPEELAKLSIRQLNLSNNQLSGSFPQTWGSSTFRTLLDLSNNKLTGSLNPPSVWRIQTVRLYNNLLTSLGSAAPPTDGSSLTSELDAHSNRFSGPIPAWVFQLGPSIPALDLSLNKLTAFPAITVEQFTLIFLNLSTNAISGSIPDYFLKLDTLDLSNNKLTGPINQQFGSGSPNLNVLNLAHNRLSGPIPPTIFTNLFFNTILLNDNLLTGSIPANNTATFLTYVDFSNNALEGSVPASLFAGKPALQAVKLGHNKLTGAIPDFSSGCESLKAVNLENNRLTGPVVPDVDLRPCRSSLQVYDVSTNLLSGGLAGGISKLESLRVLDASSNQLSGKVKGNLKQLTKLQVLDLSHNLLSGTVPFRRLASGLTQLKQGGNGTGDLLTGYYTDAASFVRLENGRVFGLGVFDVVYRVDASYVLALSGNQLRGEIDPALAGLRALQLLALNDNRFSGGIPSVLGSGLKDLRVAKLANNQLSGPIPSQWSNFPAADFAGNPGLCGPPLQNACG